MRRFLPVAGARKHRRAKSLLLVTVLASLGAFALVGGALLLIDPGAPKHEAIKTGGLAGGAIVALYALWLNDRRRKVEEARQELESQRIEHDRSRVADERFARAVELLGHDAAQVRVGAMHALAGLAKSRPEYTQTVLDILCAYLRRPFKRAEEDLEDYDAEQNEIELEVRLTSQRLIEDLLPRVEEKDPVRYDLVLQAVGRSPNGKKIGADKAGVIVGERGFIPVDVQMRTNVPHIFAIGDIVGQPMLAHKAVHEAHVAAEVAAGEAQGKPELARAAFDATVIPGVAYTHPEVAWVGYTEAQAKAEGKKVEVAKFPWAASGRAIANGADYGFTKLVFDADTHRVIGGTIVGPSAGDMIGEVCLAIEMGADAVDIGRTIHPHPTLGETVGMAAEVAHGSCTDLPPARKK